MCLSCDAAVAAAGESLDTLMAAERMTRQGMSEYDAQQCTMRLANVMLDAFIESPDQHEALRQMALGFATCVTRLLAAQDIYGMPS